MTVSLAFLEDIPQEVRDEIYDVYIRKSQLAGALYHDTCIATRRSSRNFHYRDEEYADLITIDFNIRRVGNQIGREFTSRMARFVPLHLHGIFQKGEKSFRVEKESLELILPVQIVDTEHGKKEECTEESKGIFIEADYDAEPVERKESNNACEDSETDSWIDQDQPFEWYDGPPTDSPINDPLSEYWDEMGRRQSGAASSDPDGDGGGTNGSEDAGRRTSSGWAGQNPVFDGSSASEHGAATQSTQPPEIWSVSTEGVEEFCRRLMLLEKTQDIVIRFDTQYADWWPSRQSASRAKACENVREVIAASIERIPNLKRYCVQVGEFAVFTSRKKGSTVATSEDHRITSETTEDWRSDAQYRKLLDDLNICW
ncbi:hypothetical protein CERZMDRAFT_92379 [Cercospora zeae-maydis SCOH1-5]|uniref:Uncharacterized protein n=1 Tax=Cercospora zeae-maydis SCOH1-5 TaxID=717836 RepID=A0A6A6FWB8_9PEZI|nr:hypothetical protein CERZMDRAFT_92379 [Cercospora zeae-maydis SCOH1-5]